MRARLVLLFILFSSFLGIFAGSCASSGEIPGQSEVTSHGATTTSSTTGNATTGSGTGSMATATSTSGAGASATAASSTGSAGGGGNGGSGAGGSDGGDDCSMGCEPGYVDADNNMATGVCGCEHSCATCPPNLWNIDSNPLTGVCGCEYSCKKVSEGTDPIDPNYTDDNCDGGDGVVEQCVYVSGSLGSSTGTGTRQSPVNTIAQGIATAKANAVTAVCLSGEIYGEGVFVASNISIYGGFDQNDPDFKFRRSPKVTTTVKATGLVFYAPKIDQDTHIEGLNIEAAPDSAPSSSTYGVLLGGGSGQLFVRYNTITAGAGHDGLDGTSGKAPSTSIAPTGKNGTAGAEENNNSGIGGPAPICTVPGGKGGDGGANTAAGQNGSPGNGGALGGSGAGFNGCTPAINNPGTPGGAGQNGTPGLPSAPGNGGLSLGTIDMGLYLPGHGKDGLQGGNGKAGGGGGGGGGGSNAFPCNWDKGGGGGSGGCGGVGGNPGTGGRGGGGSFAIFVASGKVVVDGNPQLVSGDGGKGGRGGDGAVGQLGGTGGLAGAHSDDSGPGGQGGSGAKGASGSPGGGGGGGPSACLAASVSAIVTYGLTNSCNTGIPGQGGLGGSNQEGTVASGGSSGKAGTKLLIN